MGKKKANELGRSLIKNRFSNSQRKKVDENMLHSRDLNDGYDWNRINFQSVTEEDSFQDFLRTAELAGTEFQAEKLNIQFVNPKTNVGILTASEKVETEKKMKENKEFLRIPRRPKWDKTTTPEELNSMENATFLEWRRELATLQETEGLIITPYEKNLEFWRQLWRVVEKSDVVVQIVDARNPLLFRSEDLEKYVKEVDSSKKNVLLLNKADFLNDSQRKHWAEYFDELGMTVAFFSALDSEEDAKKTGNDSEDDDEDKDVLEEEDEDEDDEEVSDKEPLSLQEIKEKLAEIDKGVDEVAKSLDDLEIPSELEVATPAAPIDPLKNNPNILSRQDLIDFFKEISKSEDDSRPKVIGLIGYPNVGKSSTINALLMEKKVSVSATPGKTKHFQTLFLEKDLILCDCCGLVLPSFVATKADMVLNGILPIDQLRDHVPPVNLLCSLIPRHILEDKYGLLIAKPMEGEDPDRPPHSEELLLAYGYNRGFMTANGQPDQSRSARYILKDFVNGRLLHCHSPPTVDQNEYHQFPMRSRDPAILETLPPRQQRSMKIQTKVSTSDVDKAFFQEHSNAIHVQGKNNFMNFQKGAVAISSGASTSSDGISKPWKHQKREKREKLRRKYAYLDQH